jgi:hypothetical protein
MFPDDIQEMIYDYYIHNQLNDIENQYYQLLIKIIKVFQDSSNFYSTYVSKKKAKHLDWINMKYDEYGGGISKYTIMDELAKCNIRQKRLLNFQTVEC